MKFKKFIIPVSISLAAFVWGYRGELWTGAVDPAVVSSTPAEKPEINDVKKPSGSPSSAAPLAASPFSAPAPIPGGSPIKARQLPLSNPDDTDDYAPEDDGQSADGDSSDDSADQGDDPGDDQGDDQAVTDEEPGADDSANEDVDSNADQGDLQADETADTADKKPVKP